MSIDLGLVNLPPMDFKSGVPQNAIAKAAKAVMFVIKVRNGRQFSDTVIRPFQYNFDENFKEETLGVLEEMRKVTHGHRALLDGMMSRTNLSDYIIPSAIPQLVVKTSQLNDAYRFVLILTEKPESSLINGNTFMHKVGGSEYKRIYTGFFLDEPYNPLTGTANSHANVVITHKTILNSHTDYGAYGPQTFINSIASESVHNGDIGKNITANLISGGTDNSLFLTTPENAVNSSSAYDDGFGFQSPGGIIDTGAVKFTDTLEQPTHHASVIVKGFINSNEADMQRAHLSVGRSESMLDEYLGSDYGNSRRSHHFALPSHPKASPFDLDENTRISLGHLDRLVNGDMEMIRLFVDNPIYYDTVDQFEKSSTNMYSSLIASVVCPILNTAGLTSIGFEYSIRRRPMMPDENFIIQHVSVAWDMPQDQQVAKIRAIQYELSNGIFKTIFQAMGDFSVLVHADTTGMTKVRLSLIGAGYKCQADFEYASCLGGIVSPLLANSLTSASNAEQMDRLFSHTQNAISNKNHTAEDRDFMQYGYNLMSHGNSQYAGYDSNIIID